MPRDLAIAIRVDTTQADAALRSTERELTRVGSEAAAANSSTKTFGSTVEKLGGALPATSNGVDDLRKRLAGMRGETETLTQKLSLMRSGTDESSSAFSKIGSVMGKLLPVLGAVFTVQAVTQWGKAILDDADALTKLHDKTGLSVEALQRLRAVGTDSGNSVDELTSAVSMFQNRAAEGDKSMLGALGRLGLSLQALRALDPEEQFYAIAKAIQAVPDPLERTRDAMDLFGRSGASILPSLMADVDKLGKSFSATSAESIAALDRLGDTIGAFWLKVKTWSTEGAGVAVRAVETLIGRFKILQAFVSGSDALPTVGSPSKAFGQAFAVPGLPSPDILEASDRALKKLIETNKKAVAEADKLTQANERFRASVKNLTSDAVGAKGFGAIGILMKEAAGRGEEFGNVLQGLNEDGTLASHAIQELHIKLQSLGSKGFKGATDGAQSFGSFLRNDLGRNIIGAFQGGGRIASSIGSSIGGFLAGPNGILGKAIGSIGGSLGSMLGGVAGPLGSILGGIGGQLLGKLFKNPEKEINPVRQAFVDAAGGLDTLNKRAAAAGVTLHALLDAKNPEMYKRAIEDLTKAFEFQDQAMAFLDETVKKYGFSIEELGPAFARQQLDKQAQQLFKEFSALTAAGISVDTVLEKMSASVVTFVQDALRTGTEIPSAMEPMIKRMQEMGLLLDVNGNVITNLEEAGVKFALTMSDGFKSLISEVQKLTDAISRGLGLAISNIPAVRVPVHIEDPEVSNIPVVPMAQGGMGRVTKPTLFYSRGQEDYAFSGEGRSFGRGSSGGAGTVVLELDGRRLAEVQLPYLPDAVKRFKLSR